LLKDQGRHWSKNEAASCAGIMLNWQNGGTSMGIVGARETKVSFYSYLFFIALVSLAACGGSRTYWLNLRPHPAAMQGGTTTLTVGIVPFEDARPASQRLGVRVLGSGKEEPIRLDSLAVSEDVTHILRHILKTRKIRSVEMSGWQPAPQNLAELPAEVDIAIAGRIETLEVKAQSTSFKSTIQYGVKVSAAVGLKAQEKVVTKIIEVRPEETVIGFNREKVEKSLNEAVTSAVNRLVEAALSSAKQA
jgi:hypothetical protein